MPETAVYGYQCESCGQGHTTVSESAACTMCGSPDIRLADEWETWADYEAAMEGR